MKQTIYSTLTAMLFLVLSYGCTNKTTGAFYTYETECLGTELDGSQTLWAWGTGKNKQDAIEQAHKNAVFDVIFKGIRSGSPGCNTKPLVFEPNAREKYENYFNSFFADKGAYSTFVTTEDRRRRSDQKQNADRQQKWGTTVRVLRSQLKDRLIQDQIINN